MFKRRDYFKEDRQKPWSIKDEPVTCEALADTEARTYPDMFEAYKILHRHIIYQGMVLS